MRGCFIRNSNPVMGIAFGVLLFFLPSLIIANPAMAAGSGAEAKEEQATEKQKPSTGIPVVPLDEYNRGTPRGTFKGFIAATRDGKYEVAANFLDLRNLPQGWSPQEGPELAHRLKIILDRALWVDIDLVSG